MLGRGSETRRRHTPSTSANPPHLSAPTSRIAGVAANDASAIATIVSPVAILPPAPAHTIIHTAQRLRQDAAWLPRAACGCVRSIDGHPVCVKRCRSAAANAWPLLCCVRHKLFSMNISTSAQPMVSLQQPWGSAVACRSSSKLSKPYLWHRVSENVSITGSTRTKKNGRMQWHTKRGYVVRARVGQVHRARHSLGPFTFREHQLPAWAQLHNHQHERRGGIHTQQHASRDTSPSTIDAAMAFGDPGQR